MFEIFIKDDDFKEPELDLYYILAANGLFQVKINGFYTAHTRIFEPRGGRNLGWLQEHTPGISLHLPKKISGLRLRKIANFFRQICKQCDGAEAIALIYWSKEKNDYVVRIPDQYVSRNSLPHYKVGASPPGLFRVGDIHSHGNLPASHSAVDQKDEEHDDGIHITLGNVEGAPNISCSVVCDGQRQIFPHQSMINTEENSPTRAWWAQVEESKPPVPKKVVIGGLNYPLLSYYDRMTTPVGSGMANPNGKLCGKYGKYDEIFRPEEFTPPKPPPVFFIRGEK